MITFKGIQMSPDFPARSQKAIRHAQDALDKKCIELLEDYTPIAMERFENHGKMSKAHKQEKPGVIINTEPKARREYYINKGGSGGNRGNQWMERMKADHMPELKKIAKENCK